ncbi:hypothetical protein IW245_006222 [Longispora fulva]|uniref:Uncharacterized protein n=1 Tax=Longispora fulva TaxID=619741 RepID=A0A8J7GG47_9ACTN|nr:hypothetical protein [Longispora fulva]
MVLVTRREGGRAGHAEGRPECVPTAPADRYRPVSPAGR